MRTRTATMLFSLAMLLVGRAACLPAASAHPTLVGARTPVMAYKTFTDRQDGYSLNYPADWQFGTDVPSAKLVGPQLAKLAPTAAVAIAPDGFALAFAMVIPRAYDSAGLVQLIRQMLLADGTPAGRLAQATLTVNGVMYQALTIDLRIPKYVQLQIVRGTVRGRRTFVFGAAVTLKRHSTASNQAGAYYILSSIIFR